MTKREQIINELHQTENWLNYIESHSELPGKRANLELLDVVADLGNEELFLECLKYNESTAPTNTPGEFVAACGVTGLGKLIIEGKNKYLGTLRSYASDNRWRVREGVAFALQYIGKKDFNVLIEQIQSWKDGNPMEQRAIVAGLCEPALIAKAPNALKVLNIIEDIMNSIPNIVDRKSEAFRVLKKGLGYGLSVAMVAYPEKGKALFESLLKHLDKDIKWILKENLKKNRLMKMDAIWTEKMKSKHF